MYVAPKCIWPHAAPTTATLPPKVPGPQIHSGPGFNIYTDRRETMRTEEEIKDMARELLKKLVVLEEKGLWGTELHKAYKHRLQALLWVLEKKGEQILFDETVEMMLASMH